jgi:hypothetical protein
MRKKIPAFTVRRLASTRQKVRAVSGLVKPGHAVGVEQTLRRYLLYFIMPLWMGAGLLDWYHHRRTRIEETAGTHESMIHVLMMSQIELPIMVGLFIDVNALVLALLIAAFGAHEATAYWDVSYAEGRREVTPGEQHTHSFLEALPFMVVSCMICLYWDQFLALLGMGRERARFELRLKRRPLARGPVSRIVAALTAFVVLPYAEELWRCYRFDHTLDAHPPIRQCDR